MNADTRRRLRAADIAEKRAAEKLAAARLRLADLMEEAILEGASIRDVADETGRAKSQVHRVVSR